MGRDSLPVSPTISRVSGTSRLICDCGLPITCRAKATFSATVLPGSSRKSWNTTPILRRSPGTFQLCRRLRSLPATKMRPLVARYSRSTSLMKVDLPEPELPTRKTNSPLSMVTFTSDSAARRWPS